jgi:ribosomal protein L2
MLRQILLGASGLILHIYVVVTQKVVKQKIVQIEYAPNRVLLISKVSKAISVTGREGPYMCIL